MNEQLDRLENYLRGREPILLADLNPPATDAEIEGLEASLRVRLPKDYVALLQRYNGQKGQAEWLFDGKQFLPIRAILMAWSTLCSLQAEGDFDDSIALPHKGIRDCWWSKGWIPITANGLGDHLCLDLDPAKEGVNGQIINFVHDSPERSLVTTEFGVWFTQFVERKIK